MCTAVSGQVYVGIDSITFFWSCLLYYITLCISHHSFTPSLSLSLSSRWVFSPCRMRSVGSPRPQTRGLKLYREHGKNPKYTQTWLQVQGRLQPPPLCWCIRIHTCFNLHMYTCIMAWSRQIYSCGYMFIGKVELCKYAFTCTHTYTHTTMNSGCMFIGKVELCKYAFTCTHIHTGWLQLEQWLMKNMDPMSKCFSWQKKLRG